ncbi:MAG TPA: hypothetical protein VII56_21940 [Rhizomicrobium sp.]
MAKEKKYFDLSLRRAPDDAKLNTPEFQAELKDFLRSLRSAGVTASQHIMTMDAVDAGSIPLADFVIVAPVAITAIASVAVAWVKARYGRKVSVTIDGVKVEGASVQEIEQLLKQVSDFLERKDD